ncbi:MAG: hypothetical protein GF398_00175 [Chitinivibrionales bacterium]|nr:hypothetical protein [Chitinivibrionales bacterium]
MRSLLLSGLIFTLVHLSPGQDFNNEEYQKALWMTTRMYGGQRSGNGPNWLIMDHGSGNDFVDDSDGSYDLSGGWHDCGDHVKFGQTQYYSAYMLLKAYAEWPTGFDDYYSFDYRGYHQAGDFSWASQQGTPNGIPDILDEVKYATNYFIKCARDDNTFYYQVGEGAKDHKQWVTSVKMATLAPGEGGPPRTAFKNPNGSSMASFCGATLALMARLYRKFDAAYSDECLEHALHAYAYADVHHGAAGAADGSFYPANARWEDDFIVLLTELYVTTGDDTYKNKAIDYAAHVRDHNWSLCYNNNDELAIYNLALLNFSGKKNALHQIAQRYKNNVTAEGVGKTGNQWGALRYSASQAYACALNDKLHNSTSIDPFILNTIDYIMGSNNASQSFIVGFGATFPMHPHHRNVFLDDRNVSDAQKNNLQIPQRNIEFGFMVGGSLDPNSYVDDINSYQYSEGGIDYNAGLVGALGYIVSRLAPVDTSKFSGVSIVHDLRRDHILPGYTEHTFPFLPNNAQAVYLVNGRRIFGMVPPEKICAIPFVTTNNTTAKMRLPLDGK